MIGCIDRHRDIAVYFKDDDVKRLESEVLEGALIKIHRPKQQGKVFVSISDSRYNENGFGIGVADDGWGANEATGKIELFVRPELYQQLAKVGVVGLRYGQMGSKVTLYDISRLGGLEAVAAEHLEFYRDNKEQLDPRLG